jgi:hypothetical protein
MQIERIIEFGINNPRKLFLVDGLGAIVSAVLLGVVLVEFDQIFGIPKPVLYFLAILPCLFAVYDFYCLVTKQLRFAALLKAIAIMNICYSCLSIGLAIYHYKAITGFGWIFIILENVTVIALANLEFRVAKELG